MTPGNEVITVEAATATFVSENASSTDDPANVVRAAFFAGAALGFKIAADLLKESQS